jgi:hypothetical protein
MEKDLTYIPDITTAECFSCKESFKLYTVQKMGMNFCRMCGINNKFAELITLPNILKKIAKFAEKENERIDDRLVVDVSNLFIELQKEDNAGN